MAFSGSQHTRLGLCATPRGLYGSFAGKALVVLRPLATLRARDRATALRPGPRAYTLAVPPKGRP